MERRIGEGGRGIFTLTADGIAFKTAKPGNDRYLKLRRWYISREHYIYCRMGPHPRLPTVLDWDPETCALSLEYLVNGSLQSYMFRHKTTAADRIQCITNLLTGLCHVHACGIIHCDLTLRNLLLDANLRLKIADIESSSIDEGPCEGCAAGHFSPPRIEDEDGMSIYGMREEIFTSDCTMCSILGGEIPLPDIEDDDEVDALWSSGQ